MNNYLILGGSGFIGSKIVEKLCHNNKVVVADIVSLPKFSSLPNVTFKQVDFVNTVDFSAFLEGIDTVIHLVSTVLPSVGTDNIKNEIMDNIVPTINLMDSIVRAGVKKIIFISSGGTVYGESNSPLNEDYTQNPICKYGVHKLVIEKYLHLYNVYHNIDYRIIRFSNPYGSQRKRNKQQGIIPIFINNIINEDTITIWGDGENVRDYIHIDDATNAVLAVDSYDGENRIFNVGTGIGYSLNQVIRIITSELGCNTPKIEYKEARACDVRNNILDIGLLQSCTGWRPMISLEEGVRLYIHDEIEKVPYREEIT